MNLVCTFSLTRNHLEDTFLHSIVTISLRDTSVEAATRSTLVNLIYVAVEDVVLVRVELRSLRDLLADDSRCIGHVVIRHGVDNHLGGHQTAVFTRDKVEAEHAHRLGEGNADVVLVGARIA